MTHAELRAALAAIPSEQGPVDRNSVSGTLANLCNANLVSRAGQRPGPTGRPATIFVATGEAAKRGDTTRPAGATRARRGTPLPEEKLPREVRAAVSTLRRRGWSVWPIDDDTWEAGGRRTTDQLLDLADRVAPELAERGRAGL